MASTSQATAQGEKLPKHEARHFDSRIPGLPRSILENSKIDTRKSEIHLARILMVETAKFWGLELTSSTITVEAKQKTLSQEPPRSVLNVYQYSYFPLGAI